MQRRKGDERERERERERRDEECRMRWRVPELHMRLEKSSADIAERSRVLREHPATCERPDGGGGIRPAQSRAAVARTKTIDLCEESDRKKDWVRVK